LFLYAIKLPEFTIITYFFLSTVISLWHHSDIKYVALLASNTKERNSNYGMILSFWDKLFSNYTAPKNTENDIEFGLEYFRTNTEKTFINVLLQPKRYKKK